MGLSSGVGTGRGLEAGGGLTLEETTGLDAAEAFGVVSGEALGASGVSGISTTIGWISPLPGSGVGAAAARPDSTDGARLRTPRRGGAESLSSLSSSSCLFSPSLVSEGPEEALTGASSSPALAPTPSYPDDLDGSKLAKMPWMDSRSSALEDERGRRPIGSCLTESRSCLG